MSLEALKKEVLNCNKCGLAKTRNRVIFGEGNSHAPILIIGEAPGRDEDMQAIINEANRTDKSQNPDLIRCHRIKKHDWPGHENYKTKRKLDPLGKPSCHACIPSICITEKPGSEKGYLGRFQESSIQVPANRRSFSLFRPYLIYSIMKPLIYQANIRIHIVPLKIKLWH